MVLRNVEVRTLLFQHVKTLFALAPADDFTNAWHQHIHRRNCLAIVVRPHVEGLDARRIVRHDDGTADVLFDQPAFVLALQVHAPFHGKLEFLLLVGLGVAQQVDGLGVGQMGEGGVHHSLQPCAQRVLVTVRLGQLLLGVQLPLL